MFPDTSLFVRQFCWFSISSEDMTTGPLFDDISGLSVVVVGILLIKLIHRRTPLSQFWSWFLVPHIPLWYFHGGLCLTFPVQTIWAICSWIGNGMCHGSASICAFALLVLSLTSFMKQSYSLTTSSNCSWRSCFCCFSASIRACLSLGLSLWLESRAGLSSASLTPLFDMEICFVWSGSLGLSASWSFAGVFGPACLVELVVLVEVDPLLALLPLVLRSGPGCCPLLEHQFWN